MEVEERAKTMGWVPKDDFKGDPERWTSAEDYVDKADNIMPIMRAQNKKYEEQLKNQSSVLESTKAELASMKKTVDSIVRVNTKVSEREYERALETIRNEQAVAIENNDGDKFKELEADKDKLIENKPEKIVVEESKPDGNPAFDEWVVKNDWYNTDTELREYSDYMATVVSKANPQLYGADLFDTVKDRVKATFPSKFENPNRQEPGAVDGGTNQGQNSGTGGSTYSDLPDDAKTACNQFVEDGLGKKKDYVDMYFEEE